MVRKTVITIIGGITKTEPLTQIYDTVKADVYPPAAKECEYKPGQSLILVLDEDSPAYQYALQVSQEHHLHPHIAQRVYHTRREIEQSAYFQLRISAPLELEGTDASDYGTQYIGGCPHCGLGKKPVGDVLVDRKFIKKYQMGSLFPEIFVSKEVKELIEANGFTGVSFPHRIKDFKGREMPEYYVMEISSILPPMSQSAWLRPTAYPSPAYAECGHQVLYFLSDAQYETEKMANACDFNLTCEYVNNFREQEIIISARVRKCFKENKLRVGYFPVALL